VSLIMFVFASLIGALFVWASAAVVGVEHRSYTKSLVTMVITGIGTAIFGAVLNFLSIGGGWIVYGLLITMQLFVFKTVFTTSWGKAFGAWVVQVIAFCVLVVAPIFLIFGLALRNSSFGF